MTVSAGELFDPLVTTPELQAATGAGAWVGAMLRAEAALARAEADVGVVPGDVAETIATVCAAVTIDPATLGRAGASDANPVVPLVNQLRELLPDEAASWVHWGATSQDILDTAAMLVARDALGIVEADLGGLAAGCAALADEHRHTLMAGRTLLRHALPITFGLKAAGWLEGIRMAAGTLRHASDQLAAQLGGAAGTLASLGSDGPAVSSRYAELLGLAEPVLPWHSARQRVAALAAAVAVVAGSAAKIAVDVSLLMQDEVGEAFEPGGSSSAMPHKRNPARCVGVSAAWRRASALVPVVLGSLSGEHERGVGAWQAEWGALADLLATGGGAVAGARSLVDELQVVPTAMAANLAGDGAMLAEAVTVALADRLGRRQAAERTAAAARRLATRQQPASSTQDAGGTGTGTGTESRQSVCNGSDARAFAKELAADPVVAAVAGIEELERLTDPASYLGATATWIERALAAFQTDPLAAAPSSAGEHTTVAQPTTATQPFRPIATRQPASIHHDPAPPDERDRTP